MQNFNNETRSAIALFDLGIQTVVLTRHQNIVDGINKFNEAPDKTWCNGLGKKYLHKILLRKLLIQDKYFTLHPNKVKPTNQKWRDFCDDCVILFCLDVVLNDSVVELVHPDIYKQIIEETAYDGSIGYMPDLIAGIPRIEI